MKMFEKGRKKNAQSNFVEYVYQHRKKREMHEYFHNGGLQKFEENQYYFVE